MTSSGETMLGTFQQQQEWSARKSMRALRSISTLNNAKFQEESAKIAFAEADKGNPYGALGRLTVVVAELLEEYRSTDPSHGLKEVG